MHKYKPKLWTTLVVLLAFAVGYLALDTTSPKVNTVQVTALGTPETWTTWMPTTTTIPPTTTRVVKPKTSRAAVRPRQPTIVGDDIWTALARCESGGRPDAVSRSGKYHGAFQFSLATWRGIGMSGNPIDYPYDVQLGAAKRLQARSGWGQWPTCARKLGLI